MDSLFGFLLEGMVDVKVNLKDLFLLMAKTVLDREQKQIVEKPKFEFCNVPSLD